jgi:CMP-N,N'-diacetyllegionaminic acid synthase
LLAYSIATGSSLAKVDNVVVSTDDSEIAEIALSYGAQVVMRPVEIAGDSSRDDSMILHALEILKCKPDTVNVIFLRPTHPIRSTMVVETALLVYLQNLGIDSLRSMKKSSEIIFKSWFVGNEGLAIPAFNPTATEITDPSNAPRQELPQSYYQDGYVDIFPGATVRDFGNTSGKRILPFLINDFSHDIDTLDDFSVIENFLVENSFPEWMAQPKKCH